MELITQSARIDGILEQYRPALGRQFVAYRHHVYRVLNCCACLDDDWSANRPQYELALAFHDLGIWTAGTFDYLDPSVALLENYLEPSGPNDRLAELRAMILWHHKLWPYRGAFSQTVEVMRRADLVDVSGGILLFSVPRPVYRQLRRAFPDAGFHAELIRQFRRHWRQHWLSPLPMVQW